MAAAVFFIRQLLYRQNYTYNLYLQIIVDVQKHDQGFRVRPARTGTATATVASPPSVHLRLHRRRVSRAWQALDREEQPPRSQEGSDSKPHARGGAGLLLLLLLFGSERHAAGVREGGL